MVYWIFIFHPIVMWYFAVENFFLLRNALKKSSKNKNYKWTINNVYHIYGHALFNTFRHLVSFVNFNKLKLKFPSNFIAVFWKVFIFMGYWLTIFFYYFISKRGLKGFQIPMSHFFNGILNFYYFQICKISEFGPLLDSRFEMK
jgi:hypothetical protein